MVNDELDGLVQRVQELEDKAALRTLMVLGWRALDYLDFDTWSDGWTEDATFDFAPWGVLHGRAAIRQKVQSSESDYAHMMHHILNMDFKVDGDTATGVGFMWFRAIADAGNTAESYNMGGPYEWEYRRDPDRWRISAMRLGVWYVTGEDTVEAFGSRSRSDTAPARS